MYTVSDLCQEADLRSAMAAKGLSPSDDVELEEGVYTRFPDPEHPRGKAAWCYLETVPVLGVGPVQFAVFGSWWRQATSANGQAGPWFWSSPLADITPEQLKAVEAARQEAQARAEAAREQHRHEGAEAAAALMVEAKEGPASDFPYMARKGFGPAVTIFTRDNEMLVPYQNLRTGELQAVQRITATGAKFWVGSPTGAGCCWMGPPPTAATTRFWISEGLVTAISVHLVTREPVVSVGPASNILHAVRELRQRYPATPLWGAFDEDEAGRKAATAVLRDFPDIPILFPDFSMCPPPPTGKKRKDWDDLRQINPQEVVRQLVGMPNTTGPGEIERLPLTRELSPCAPYPLEALGKVLEPAARALIRVVQVPPALAAQSLLAASALCCQPHADILVEDRRYPLSLFLFTVVPSGGRKSEGDKRALQAVHAWQRELVQKYNLELAGFDAELSSYEAAKKDLLKAKRGKVADIEQVKQAKERAREAEEKLGAPPERPLLPNLLASDPTPEGLIKLFQAGQPSLGIFSDEGGLLIGGHAMAQESRLRTIATLSKAWDGAPLDRVRGGDGALLVYDKRLSLHLQLQPEVAAEVLNTSIFRNQGFLNRVLMVWPDSIAGNRPYRTESLETDTAIRLYNMTLTDLLKRPYRLKPGSRNELDPLPLTLSKPAYARWVQFHDVMERQLAKGGLYEPIQGFAAKAAEQALRIAGVLSLLNNTTTIEIALEHLEAAVVLMEFYLAEHLRIVVGMGENPDINLARKLLEWAQPLGKVHLRQIYRLGPVSIRDKDTAMRICKLLEDHGWFVPVPGGEVIEGSHRAKVWRVQRE